MRSCDACNLFHNDIPSEPGQLLTVETKGKHTESGKSEATFRKLKRALRFAVASARGTNPTEARMDFYEAGVDSRAMPTPKRSLELGATSPNKSE